MKKLIILTSLLFTTTLTFAQKNITKEGFWVVESNIKTPKMSIVRFYNDEQELIYQEGIKDKRINIERAKVKKALNKVLASALIKNININDTTRVMAALRR